MQEIIVYRNPLEAAIWHGLGNFDVLIPIICGIIAFFAILLISTYIIRKTWGYFGPKVNIACNVCLALSAIGAFATIYWMI